MTPGKLKTRSTALGGMFWTGGLNNPPDVVGQATCLRFIHGPDATDNLRAKEFATLDIFLYRRLPQFFRRAHDLGGLCDLCS